MDKCLPAVEWIKMGYMRAMQSALAKKEVLPFAHTELLYMLLTMFEF